MNRCAFVAGVALCLFAGAEPTRADDRPTGALRLGYSSSDKDLTDKTDVFGATLEARWQTALDSDLKAVVDGRIGSRDFVRGDTGNVRLNEAYVVRRFEGADLRIGQQIVAWGRADGLNPTDNLTPRDFKTLLPLEADQRFGVPSAKLDLYPTSEFKLSLFVTPFFQPSVFPLPVPEGVSTSERKPRRDSGNTELAIKLDRTGGEIDWSLSWFHGFSLLPAARVVQLFPTPGIELNYPKLDVLGADFARNLGQFGLRGEIAYIGLHRDETTGSERLQPTLFYVLGGDRAFGSLNINLQFVGRHVKGYRDVSDIGVPALRELALQNAITFGQRDRATYGITSRVADRWLNDTLEAEVLLYVGLNRQDSYMRPLITYTFQDQLKARIGAEYYDGGRDTFFGRLEANRRVFVELIHAF